MFFDDGDVGVFNSISKTLSQGKSDKSQSYPQEVVPIEDKFYGYISRNCDVTGKIVKFHCWIQIRNELFPLKMVWESKCDSIRENAKNMPSCLNSEKVSVISEKCPL